MYVINSLIVPFKGTKANFVIERITVENAKRLLSENEFISAIGHQGTAVIIEMMTGIKVPVNRIAIHFDIGDIAIAFVPSKRLPEGVVLNEQQLRELEIEIYLIERIN